MKFVEFYEFHFSKFNEAVVNDFMNFSSQRSSSDEAREVDEVFVKWKKRKIPVITISCKCKKIRGPRVKKKIQNFYGRAGQLYSMPAALPRFCAAAYL